MLLLWLLLLTIVCVVSGVQEVAPICKTALQLHGRGRWMDALNTVTSELPKGDPVTLLDCFFSAGLSLNALRMYQDSQRSFRVATRLQREEAEGPWVASTSRLNRCRVETGRTSNAPFLSCGSFRSLADWIHDGDNCGFDPQLVQDGDSVFVDSFLLKEFFANKHPYIRARYSLITHCSDSPAPDEFDHVLDDPKLIAWFAQNKDMSFHPKLVGIPIGLADPVYPHGNIATIQQVMAMDEIKRDKWLYININVQTNPDRERAMNALEANGFSTKTSRHEFRDYLMELKRHKFVLCPPGNGLDTHRTWEALLMGSFPVVETSTIDSLYEHLPVLIVGDWEEVTMALLEKAYLELSSSSSSSSSKASYQMEKLTIDYWTRAIKEEENIEY